MKKPTIYSTSAKNFNVSTVLAMVLFIFLILSVGYIFKVRSQGDDARSSVSRSALGSNDHVKGNASSSVRVILYSDIECPFCNSFYDYSFPKILSEYGVAFVSKTFTLLSSVKKVLAPA